MANAVTLATMRTRVLDLADMTGSSFPTQARVTDYVNQGLSQLHYALANADADYAFSTSTVTLVTGTDSYNLPSDFYKAHKLYWVDGNGANKRLFRIPQFNRNEVDGWRTSPLAAGSLELQYYPHFAPYTDTTDDAVAVDTKIPALPYGWEDYAVYHAAVQLKAREKDAAQELRAERDRLWNEILAWAAPRDAGEAEHISDVYSRWDSPAAEMFASDLRALRYRIQGTKIYVIEVEVGAR